MSQVRALLFDTFGTLVDWRTGVISQLQRWGAAHDIAADWPGLADAWRRERVPALAAVRAGQRPWANYDELQREIIQGFEYLVGCFRAGNVVSELAQQWRARVARSQC